MSVKLIFIFTLGPFSVLFAQDAQESLHIESARIESRDQVGSPCEPVWADEERLKLEGDLAVLLTHFTDRLDKEYATLPALRKLTVLSKANDWPLIYLHEGNAPTEKYFYTDCNPTAYVNSSLGHFDFGTHSLRHVVVAGGFYELCLDNTFSQVVQNWSTLSGKLELRITFVMDAIYGVASDSRPHDEFDADLRAWIRLQPSTTVLMSSALEQLKNRDHAWRFLSRRWDKIPTDFGLHVRYGDEIRAIRLAREGMPTIVIHYTTVDELANSVDETLRRPLPIELSFRD